MLKEKISEHLGKPYVYLPEQKKFLCSNGVLFTLEEYKNGININAEYERREKEDKLYDYAYAKSTGLLRKKRGTKTVESERTAENTDQLLTVSHTGVQSEDRTESMDMHTRNQYVQDESRLDTDKHKRTILSEETTAGYNRKETSRAVWFIIALLAFTSLISGYISTLQTATYLYDYVDVISAWLMSSSVTAYNVTAFEVAVLFKQNKRYGLTFVFITLWTIVTLFSMATAVSVFYDRFNFTEYQVAEENRHTDSNKLALSMLQTKEKDLREAIDFKKKDIEYRQEKDYATTAVRLELEALQKELQENLSEQQKLVYDTPEVTEETNKRKERLFAFLGRLLHVDSGVFEFIFSTMSAIFINVISPLSVVAVVELKKKKEDSND